MLLADNKLLRNNNLSSKESLLTKDAGGRGGTYKIEIFGARFHGEEGGRGWGGDGDGGGGGRGGGRDVAVSRSEKETNTRLACIPFSTLYVFPFLTHYFDSSVCFTVGKMFHFFKRRGKTVSSNGERKTCSSVTKDEIVTCKLNTS
jgi:hypothetical protein